MLSAVIGRAAARVFLEAPGILVVTTDVNLVETKKYLPSLVEKYGLDHSEVAENLRTLPIAVYVEEQYRSHLARARAYLGKRDPGDIPLAALALKLEIPVWSNDKDFRDVPVELYSTAGLLKSLGL